MSNYERFDAADPMDQASELAQMQLRLALEHQRNNRQVLHPKLAEVTDKKSNTMRVACLCHYCDAILQYVDTQNVDTQNSEQTTLPRFCDEFCRDDWQKEQDMKARTGKR